MGSEIALSFSDRLISENDFLDLDAIHASESRRIYIIVRHDVQGMPWRSLFGLWADGTVDLRAVCKGISAKRKATICLAWKSEHAGVAGYLVFEHGRETHDVADSGPGYLFVPATGVEISFGKSLDMSDSTRLGFPEVLIDGAERCYLLNPGAMKMMLAEPGVVQSLLEEELDVDPVLPVDL